MSAAPGTHIGAESPVPVSHDGQTRAAVVTLILEQGPVTAVHISDELGITPTAVRRHLDAMIASGDVVATAAPRYAHRGRGRPAKHFQLTPSGRGRLKHAYDDLAGAVMLRLRKIGGEEAVTDFAMERAEKIMSDVPVSGTSAEELENTAEQIAEALTSAGFSATTRRVGNGVQICQHHCPVAHVAAEFPELCEAETAVFTAKLGTHVQRLATIANGDCACTTHVPLAKMQGANQVDAQSASASVASGRSHI
ncbi:metalloregulator ArsR/SmtB family transcription factor [Nocardia sp. 348MFTsu5.1]|jgi:predicted ArsR family transcriptional regulator|uniref:helix-turn-helix transcriptional regulator n=1 Tax=Nocardia sp. 348MFTsu5.1 TaxID=1172185 RepID=UPI0003A978B5|nr:metalloregulator ArsR/SmtB family transcription factor [Nocardia sp. 348MFTsu5.1]